MNAFIFFIYLLFDPARRVSVANCIDEHGAPDNITIELEKKTTTMMTETRMKAMHLRLAPEKPRVYSIG